MRDVYRAGSAIGFFWGEAAHSGAGVANGAKNLTPNPFPSWKGNQIVGGLVGGFGRDGFFGR
jgi:hypothetical protein